MLHLDLWRNVVGRFEPLRYAPVPERLSIWIMKASDLWQEGERGIDLTRGPPPSVVLDYDKKKNKIIIIIIANKPAERRREAGEAAAL